MYITGCLEKSGVTSIGPEQSAPFRSWKAFSVSSVHFTWAGKWLLVRSVRGLAREAKWGINLQ
jgi:hypothetical protein